MRKYLRYDILHSSRIGMLEMIVLRYNMQEEDIMEHINAMCHVFTLVVNLLTIVQHNIESLYSLIWDFFGILR